MNNVSASSSYRKQPWKSWWKPDDLKNLPHLNWICLVKLNTILFESSSTSSLTKVQEISEEDDKLKSLVCKTQVRVEAEGIHSYKGV